MTCREICQTIRGTYPGIGKGRYSSGQKRCQTCDLFIICGEVRCPCCNTMLRSRPRHRDDKKAFRISLGVLVQ
ncbi:MAG: hypothetical protein OER82_03985 [Nitrosopumilus sp.]|nr:hypothetical protein [Nitrosopumilus sp.]